MVMDKKEFFKDKLQNDARNQIEEEKSEMESSNLKVEVTEKKKQKVPVEVEAILDRYKEIIADGIPRSLPPM